LFLKLNLCRDQDIMGGRMPTAADIDAVEEARGRPIVLNRRCWHVCVANACAMQLCGIDEHTSDPVGGQIDRVEGSRVPTGVFREVAMELLFPVTRRPQVFKSLSRLTCIAMFTMKL
jgi:predicted amidohydrolase YtcJ